jgi:4-hydroxybenzoate polyprenyltransferase
MVLQTCQLFGVQPIEGFLPFVFFGSLCSYNFHWYLTPSIYGGSYKTQWSIQHKSIHLAFFVIGFIGAAWFITFLLHEWKWLLATAFITFLYSAPKIPFSPFKELKHIAVGKTIFLSAVWMHSTVILPLVMSQTVWTAAHFLFVVNRFFFIYAICILFDYRDRIEDKKEGIKSLITHLPEKGINVLFWTSLLIVLITAIFLCFEGFSFVDALALLIPAFIVASLFNYSKNKPDDYLYYFVLDGLMMFSALLIFIFHF